MAAAEATIAVSNALAILRQAAFEPFLVGPIILALTRGPPKLQQWLQRNIPSLYRDPRRLQRILTTLKWLFALGAVAKVNKRLNAFAKNHWCWQKQGVRWNFSTPTEVAVVTGGCSGFGYLIVKGLAGKMKVVVLDVSDMPEDLKSLAGVSFYKCDITDKNAVHETASNIRSQVGPPSILINNAGIATAHTILETSEEYLEKIFRVNLLSHFTLIKEFLPSMLERRKGHIISIASMASYFVGSGLVDYSATKAGVLALHEGLNQELKHRYGPNGRCIQTSIVHPMWAQTPLVQNWQASLTAAKTVVLPAHLISDAVIAQVLSGKAGQIYVPSAMSRFSGVRGWPNWMQERARDGLDKATRPVDGGKSLMPQV